MDKIKFENGKAPAINAENLNKIQDNVEKEINLKSIFESVQENISNVTEEESYFQLPSNYDVRKSIINVFVNDVEITDYSIREQNFVNVLILTNSVSNSTVVIRCSNITLGFRKFMQEYIPVG